MAKTKFGYGWVVKWALAAILLAAGILMKIYEAQVVYAATGFGVIIFSILRVVPLMKTLNKEVLRTINLIEIIFETILGGVMLYAVFAGKVSDSSTNQTWISLYGYLLTFFLLARGVIYFVSLYYFGEKSESMKFWMHLIFVALGPAILTLTILNKDIIVTLGWLVLFITLGGALYLGYDGYGGYRKYREKSKKLNTEKQPEKDPKIEKELPKHIEDEVKQDETYVN